MNLPGDDLVTAGEIARALHGRMSGGGWVARCPAHDDTTASLSLRDADGEVLDHWHPGCEQSSVVASIRFHLKSAAEIAGQNWPAGWRGEEEE